MFKSIMRIINWTGEYKRYIFLGFVFSVLDSIFVAFPLITTGFMVNRVYEDMIGGEVLTVNEVYLSIALILGSILLRWFCSYKRSKLQDNVAYMVSRQERLKAGEILKRVPLGFFKENKTGEMTTALTTELSFFEMLAMSMIDMVANCYLFIIIVVITLFVINPLVGVIALVSLLLSMLGLFIIDVMMDRKSEIRQKAIADVSSATLEYIRGMTIIKSYNQEGVATRTYQKACESTRKINISLEKVYVFPDALHKTALYLGTCAILYTVSMLMIQNTISMEMWIMLALYSFVMFKAVENVNNATVVLGIVNATLDNLEKISTAKFIDEDGKDIPLQNYDIEFQDVHFSYNEKEVIKGVSFKIPENTTVALVGSSGSGKTTLCNLLARFYDVNSGAINVGGHDIREFSCSSLLENITMVFQNVYLFHDTIRNNICFGKQNATEEEMIEVAKKARCHDFIMALPNGYDTLVGEGGSNLSGGEKQRISIARAMLKNAKIVILDEATASVDPENEHYIQSAISELTKNKTVITIAHRLKTIEKADNIIVIDDGKISQTGKHEELLLEEGIYHNFVEIRKQAESWSF